MPDLLGEYLNYHRVSDDLQDIDPGYPMLRYVCERFELNNEQRYWLAFLYACTYCAPTVFYIYNEFPDFAGVDLGRLERWWKASRGGLIFQTDRRWVHSRNQFCEMVASYRRMLGENTQQAWFENLTAGRAPQVGYRLLYDNCGSVFQMGRFGLFLWLEAVHVVTGLNIEPDGIDWREAQSSRNGLLFALGEEHLLRGHGYGNQPLTPAELQRVEENWVRLLGLMRGMWPERRLDAWNIETTLCAFKKWRLGGKRWPGYYLDRQANEVQQMERNFPDGVCWEVLWDARRESFSPQALREFGADNRAAWLSIALRG